MKTQKLDLSLLLNTLIEWSFYCLVFFAPVFFDRRIGIVFSLSKSVWIRAFTLIIIALWATKYFIESKVEIRRTPLDFPIMSYLVCFAAATILSINVATSFAGSYGRYEGFITVISYVCLFFIAANFFHEYEKKRKVMMLMVLSAVTMSAYGLIQRNNLDPFAWGGVITNERVIGTIGQPNFFAAYLNMAFVFAMALLFSLGGKIAEFRTRIEPKKKNEKLRFVWNSDAIIQNLRSVLLFISVPAIFVFTIYMVDGANYILLWVLMFFVMAAACILYVIDFEEIDSRVLKILLLFSLALILIGILSTQSRGAWFGFICGFAVFILFSGRNIFFDHKKIWFALSGIFAVILFFSFANLGAQQAARFSEVGLKQDGGKAKVEGSGAAGSRVETWTSALGIVSDRPVFGVGPEVLKSLFPQYETEKFRFKETFHVKQDRCHNEILDMSSTRGILTLFVYIWLIAFVFWVGNKNTKLYPQQALFFAGSLGAITSYLVQNQFSFGVVAITHIFWIIIGLTVNTPSDSTFFTISSKSKKPRIEMIVILWLVVAVLLYVSALPYLADKFYKSAKVYNDGNMAQQMEENYIAALAYSPYDAGYYINYGMDLLNKGRTGTKDQTAMIKSSIDKFEKAMQLDPYNADSFFMAARAYLILQDMGAGNYLASAETLSNKAIILDHYYAESFQNLAYVSEKKADLDKAAFYYEKAFWSNPTMDNFARSLYQIRKVQGRTDLAFKFFDGLTTALPVGPSIYLLVGDFYQELGQNQKAFDKYTTALELAPGSVPAMIGLATVDLFGGRLDKAFERFQDIMLVDPANIQLHNGLGVYYLKKNDNVRAKQEFTQVLSLDPANEYAKRMVSMLK